MAKRKYHVKKLEKVPGRELINLVFSWSIQDVLNKDLSKSQVWCSTKIRPKARDTSDLGPIFSCSPLAPSAQTWTIPDHKLLEFI
ncbi:unnamed protein product [Dovyalis caffra]|uniref:Ribosomal protein L32 n=1 Tax=Dovyalis caffra TaxID=77055 RepID=A0AAV1R5U5_9ROSI|nr:unnamed protein product [Dovyalis caffra]